MLVSVNLIIVIIVARLGSSLEVDQVDELYLACIFLYFCMIHRSNLIPKPRYTPLLFKLYNYLNSTPLYCYSRDVGDSPADALVGGELIQTELGLGSVSERDKPDPRPTVIDVQSGGQLPDKVKDSLKVVLVYRAGGVEEEDHVHLVVTLCVRGKL